MSSPAQRHLEGPTRLISHFQNRWFAFHDLRSHQVDNTRSLGEQNTGWAELWESKQSNLWDRGEPSPALIDLLEQHPGLLPKSEGGRRLKTLVPVR